MTSRDALKSLARTLALVLVAPALLSFAVRRSLMGADRALEGSSQALSCLPGIFGQYLRRAFFAQALVKCAPTAVVSFGTLLSKVGTTIEDRVYVGPNCHLGLVHIERDVLIGAGVHVTSGRNNHGTADASIPIQEQQGTLQLVRIGAGAWIGSAAVIMADVGSNSVIGAGAVVTSPIPPSVVAVGVPARVIRQRE